MVAAALAAATIEAALTVAARAAAGGDQMGWQMRWRRPTVEPLFNGEIWDGDATWSSMTAAASGCWKSGCGGMKCIGSGRPVEPLSLAAALAAAAGHGH